ncbi:MAG: DMT family transporter [Deltaproteobacteria bacterium]|nr:DMT family transporter [Deltaproteobacteria bacterium]
MNKIDHSHHQIPVTAVLLLVMMSFVWGGNMVSIKLSSQGMPPIIAATIRSVFSSLLLWLYAGVTRRGVFLDRQDLKNGAVIGVLFGTEFLLLYWGATLTDVSRAVVFLYTQPLWAAIGAHFLLANDRLSMVKSLGLFSAFAGLILVFGSKSPELGSLYWVGDLMETIAGLLWAATTIYIKKFMWNRPITHFQTLFAQLFFSIPILAAGALIFEWGRAIHVDSIVAAALFYQTVVIAFLSYLLWFWMVHRFQVSILSAFTFLTPLFGVILSGVLLGEPLPVLLWVGLSLVAVGLYLVNRPKAV